MKIKNKMAFNFDIIVIGKGLVGSAAAKYLAKSGEKVAIIGTNEPQEHETPLVYASHYDQARVQRIVGKDEAWTKLNADAAQEYSTIQKESGIDFHRGVGCLYVNPYGEDEYLKNLPTLAQKFNVPYHSFKNENDKGEYFSDFHFPEKSMGIFEPHPSGHINPRLLVQAQLHIFEKQGGAIITDTVIHLSPTNDDTFMLKTASGQTYFTQKVVVATGSFMNHLDLLPQKLQLKTKSEVVLLVKIEEKMLDYYANMPSLLYEIDEDETEGIYMLPPVQYPDGHFYLKIGANSPDDLFFEDLEAIQNWFRVGNDAQYAPALIRAIQKILPNLNLENVLTKKCIISRTEHGRPYIGETQQKGLFVAGGCNGYSAMCSDAMGKVAAHFVQNNVLPEGYAPNAFEIRYA
jgi:sarcosine oxidase